MTDSEWFKQRMNEARIAKPALWELGAEILVKIENGALIIHNGIDVLWHDEERSWGSE